MENSWVTIADCEIDGCSAYQGGALSLLDSTAIVTDSVFFKNTAGNEVGNFFEYAGYGAVGWISGSSIPADSSFTRCSFASPVGSGALSWHAYAEEGGQFYLNAPDTTIHFTECDVGVAFALAGGHVFLHDGNMIANECNFNYSQVEDAVAGAIAVGANAASTRDPELDLISCVFSNNQEFEEDNNLSAACLFVGEYGTARLADCLFKQNCYSHSTPTVPGPYIIACEGTIAIRCSTIAENFGHGANLNTADCDVSNSVFYNALVNGTVEITTINSTASNRVDYSAVKGGWAFGTGNIGLTSDPFDPFDQFVPAADSPIQNAGSNDSMYLPNDGTDLDGDANTTEPLPLDCHLTSFVHRPRIAEGIVDMGAFERPCNPDINCDGNADQDDVACMIDILAGNPGCECEGADFNRDGNVDQDDLAALISVLAGGPCP